MLSQSLPLSGDNEFRPSQTGVYTELVWRQRRAPESDGASSTKVTIARWTDFRTEARDASAEVEPDYHTIAIALRATNLDFSVEGRSIHKGHVPPGAVQVSSPGQSVRGVFSAPVDALRLYVPTTLLTECYEETRGTPCTSDLALIDPCFQRDVVVDRLGNALAAAQETIGCFGTICADGISLAIVARMLSVHSNCSLPAAQPRCSPLAKWRLRRVVDYVDAHLAEPIGLVDLAASSGLSRMHFAAQFRMATGVRPHEYLLRRRIEHAQDLLRDPAAKLVEVALSVGFQSQAHFTTVFKRITAETPHRWRQLVCRDQQPAAWRAALHARPAVHASNTNH